MRHWIFALLVALLPLRGWAGEAMATGMASAHLQQVQQQVQQIAKDSKSATHDEHAHEHGGSSHDMHASLHQASASDADCGNHAAGSSAQGHGNCESCSACQTCHTVALTAGLPELKTAPVPRTAILRSAAQFASAEAAPGHKPPIS